MSGTVTIGKVRLVDSIGDISAATAVAERMTTAEADIAALEAEDAALAAATTALSTRVTTAEQDIGALETEDTALAAATTALSTRVTTAETSLASALARITEIETHYYSGP
jgi:hypothetical protein